MNLKIYLLIFDVADSVPGYINKSKTSSLIYL